MDIHESRAGGREGRSRFDVVVVFRKANSTYVTMFCVLIYHSTHTKHHLSGISFAQHKSNTLYKIILLIIIIIKHLPLWKKYECEFFEFNTGYNKRLAVIFYLKKIKNKTTINT